MNMCITEKEIKAIAKVFREARKNGFEHCLAVLEFDGMQTPHWLRLRYSDLWEKAHPTDSKYDWGRCQNITGRFRFKNGKLIPLQGKL